MTDIKRPISLQLKPASQKPPPRPHSLMATPTQATNRVRKKFCETRGSSISSSTSSSSSSGCSGINAAADSPHSPSQILPHLYVGDQAQTQIDIISSLNIQYILSLQSLPKFLDGEGEDDGQSSGENKDEQYLHITPVGELDKDRLEFATMLANDHGPGANIENDQPMQVDEQLIRNFGEYEQIDECASNKLSNEHEGQTSASMKEGENQELGQSSTKLPTKRDLLPQANASKDYLVKFKSCVNKLIKGKCINISDTFETLVDKFFDETHNFIEEARRNRCNILVHCKAGISRSPTIAIAYLMKWKRLHLQDAYDFVKRCRPQISPNLSFMGQLMSYERKLLQRDFRNYRCAQLPSPTSCCLPCINNAAHSQATIVLGSHETREDEMVDSSGSSSSGSSTEVDVERATSAALSGTIETTSDDLSTLASMEHGGNCQKQWIA